MNGIRRDQKASAELLQCFRSVVKRYANSVALKSQRSAETSDASTHDDVRSVLSNPSPQRCNVIKGKSHAPASQRVRGSEATLMDLDFEPYGKYFDDQ